MANKVGLTDARIAGLKAPASGQIELADGLVAGLRLRIGASGSKTYILRKRIQGKWLNVTIGLNHQSGSAMAGVAGVYHRHQYTNEKREALALWGREVLQIVAKYPPQENQEG